MDTEHEKKVAFEEIEIHSSRLKKLLADTDDRWRDLVEGHSQQVTLESPFAFFVWSWDKYAAACEPKNRDSPDLSAAREDLASLMQLIRSSDCLRSYFQSRDLLQSSKKIKYEHLWTIFAHGSRVYARSYGNELQMFEVTESSAALTKSFRFRVTCSAFDWDGNEWKTYAYDFYIKEFSGEKLISSLDVFPTEFYCNQEGVYDDSELRKKLRDRGQKTHDLCKHENMPNQYDYHGSALVSPTGPHRLSSKGRGPSAGQPASSDEEEVDVTSMDIASKVIIDNYAFLKSERNPMKRGEAPPLGRRISLFEYYDCICPVCKASPLQGWRLQGESRESFDANEIRLMTLPPRLLGFILKDKVWGQFSVDKLTPIETTSYSNPFWSELQLEDDSKRQLMALVKHHPKARKPTDKADHGNGIDSKSFDVIDGKGQGLAILLHGPPGVGKTLTAETIAIATGRPLLTVSVAEIGTEAHKAEAKMTDVFEDAARWEAVLLMDEADIFVEERVKGELQQNAFVSVLLRCLEYYDGTKMSKAAATRTHANNFSGIIILTTNRARSIDGAVQSRIHLAIQYHDLKPDQRLAIYKNRLKVIPDDELKDRNALERQLEQSPLGKKSSKVNGRQIRNIVAGARMLAKHEKEKMELKHLISVHDTTSEFINSMANLMERQRAHRELD
jgi:DNA polymerase III delta prime subunit